MHNLAFNSTDYKNLFTHFYEQKHIPTWYNVHTIKEYNLLERSGSVLAIIDSLINLTNDRFENRYISQYFHLESMRKAMYEDVPKTILNDLSHTVKRKFPAYAKKYKNALTKISEPLNLNKNKQVVFISKIGDILNSFFEAKIENKLGNHSLEIENVIKNVNMRFLEAQELIDDKDFSNEILKSATILITGDNTQYNTIIENTFKQKNIKRWSRKLVINKFNLLEHSARVACLVDIFLQVFKDKNYFTKTQELNIFRYALYHDYTEVIFNDMNSPVKKIFPELAESLKSIERIIMTEELKLSDSKVAKLICKIADIYDCKYEANAEKEAGNTNNEYQKVIDQYHENYEIHESKFESISEDIKNDLRTLYF